MRAFFLDHISKIGFVRRITVKTQLTILIQRLHKGHEPAFVIKQEREVFSKLKRIDFGGYFLVIKNSHGYRGGNVEIREDRRYGVALLYVLFKPFKLVLSFVAVVACGQIFYLIVKYVVRIGKCAVRQSIIVVIGSFLS